MRMKVRRQILLSGSEEDWVPPDDHDYFYVKCDSIEDSDYLNLEKDLEVNDFVLVKLLNEDKRISKFSVAKVLDHKSPDEWKAIFLTEMTQASNKKN
ncbi:hypothetical protein AVEN_178142-1 [Araneus ventricosus]|uniref:Uncharacterized protein n=1 Tax=Araneus ventricosus TaxID=182803 RepID=A0A4Y2GAM6_ARAVE|nr:hypothetical protein AVEN_178142-1 [Araneus ventricosus]